MRRAGLDYWQAVTVHRHAGLEPVLAAGEAPGGQLVLLSTHGTRPYTQFRYRRGAYLLFGNETAGLPVPNCAPATPPPPPASRCVPACAPSTSPTRLPW